MKFSVSLPLTLSGLALVLVCLAAGRLAAQTEIDFNRDIRPILSDRCFKCHGPDANSRATDLRLDVRERAEEVLTGDVLEDVELLRRIHSADEYEVMPPPDSKMSLTEREKNLLRQWIKQGAAYANHWAFERPRKPELPPVSDSAWPRNEIDRFVLAKLDQSGMTPNPPAARARLIRRLTFDLTGLPPTAEEVRQFVDDPDPNAYEKVVDELLSRRSYGERMTADWLDVARYSDSFGYQVDRDRHVWPWRDWVIEAFNQNMPYRQFIVEQLAGDMLPDAGRQQILATAFNRLHPQKVEGGSVPEEFRVEYVADRTHTFGTAFLGLTLECARCHDHKYDPISQREYYQLFAYFNNIDEAGLYSYFTSSTPTPTLLLSDDQRDQQIADIRNQILAAEEKLNAFQASAAAFESWLAGLQTSPISEPIESQSFEDFKGGNNQSVAGIRGQGVRLTGDDAIGMKTGNFTRNQPFSISLWINTPDVKQRAVVLHRSRAWTDAGSRGYQMLIEDGQLSVSLIHFWPGNAIRVKTEQALPTQKWIQVGFSYDGSSRAAGLQIYVDGQPAASEVVRDNLYKNITGGGGDQIAIGERFRDNGFKNGQVDEVQVFDRQLTEWEFQQLYETTVDPSAALTAEQLREQASQNDQLNDHLRQLYQRHHDPAAGEIRKSLQTLRESHSKLVDPMQEIMVMRENANRRPTYLLARGAYDRPTEPVTPGLPEALGVSRQPATRLELAQWLVSDENPLTARVTVNRYWQLIFGEGLVRTPEDFGSQGAPPTHQQLLDWLAKDLMENDWNLKRLIKQMVMSATYRQDSTLTRAAYQKDPGNQLLARASSFRLPPEMLRDNALFASGLLVDRVGGPGAKPYDLALSFKPVGVDQGDGLYRRSVYTYWKRTGPSPVMMTLDASKRDVCTVKRERTATPLQSFVLLNAPQFVEAARSLAIQTWTTHQDPKPAIHEVFLKLTSRPPSDRESEVLAGLFQSQLESFRADPEAAARYLKVGQRNVESDIDSTTLAALTSVVQTVMNFDECVTRR